MEHAATTSVATLPRMHRKVVVYGATRCGKTSLMRRWSDNEFSASEAPTIGVNVHIRKGAQVWDSSGHERFHTLVLTYMEGADAVLFMYNIVDRSSFDELVSHWIPKVMATAAAANRKMDYYLVGTHLDMEEERAVSVEDAVALAARYDFHYGECSAKTGQSIDHLRLFLEQPTGNNAREPVAVVVMDDEKLLQVLEPFPPKPRLFFRCCNAWRGRKYAEIDPLSADT